MKTLKRFIGSGFGPGYIPFAPGTWGSLTALIPISALVSLNEYYLIPLFVVLSSLLCLWVSEECEAAWGKDPSKLVMDEWAGQGLTFLLISFTGDPKIDFGILFAGFILFRIFDIWKPLGIKKLQNFNGAWGILMDDLLAGFYAFIFLKSLIFFSF